MRGFAQVLSEHDMTLASVDKVDLDDAGTPSEERHMLLVHTAHPAERVDVTCRGHAAAQGTSRSSGRTIMAEIAACAGRPA